MQPESISTGRAPLPSGGASATRARPRQQGPAAEPGRLNEIYAASEDIAAAAALALSMAAGASAPGAPIVWLRAEAAERRCGRVHGPGLVALGIDPARLMQVVLPDDLALLKAAADLLRGGGPGALLLELHGSARHLDLTSSRRLALAAASRRTPTLLLRIGADPVPSAAWQRWSVKARASVPLAGNAPGNPIFVLELLRSKAGPAGATYDLQWQETDARPPETQDDPDTADVACAAVPVSSGRPRPPLRLAG